MLVALLLLAAPQAVPVPASAEKKVCRPVQRTGSIMPGGKECHTRAEWQSRDAASRAAMEQARGAAGRSMPSGGTGG